MEEPLAETEQPKLKTKTYVRVCIDRWRELHKEEYARKHLEYNRTYRANHIEKCRMMNRIYNQQQYHKSKCGCRGENCIDYTFLLTKHDNIKKEFYENNPTSV